MTHDYARPLVVKYGGNAMAAEGRQIDDPVLAEVASLHRAGQAVVLVHGGGPEIDAALTARGIRTTRVGGQRVTDAATLRVTEAVLCGTVNKRIVRSCAALGIDAAGISGVDGRTLLARRAIGIDGEDLGFVGEISTVDTRLIETLLASGFLPVVAPLALSDTGADTLNVNADGAAGAVAAALQARALILITNVRRVLRNPDDRSSGIAHLTPDEAVAFAQTNACRSSMKPKLIAAATAARHATPAYICPAKANGIDAALKGDATIISQSNRA
jgi:acetylglutamate kinase